MDMSAFLVALKACFTEREVDRLSARAIRLGLSEVAVMSSADNRLRILLDDDAGIGMFPADGHGWGYQDQEASQFVY